MSCKHSFYWSVDKKIGLCVKCGHRRELCKICGKSLRKARMTYKRFRVCGETCHQNWIRQIKAEVKKEMKGLKISRMVIV